MRLFVSAIFLLAACGSRTGESSEARESTVPESAPPGASGAAARAKSQDTKTVAKQPAATGPARRLHRDLVAEASRAELYAGGLLVDIGSADMHKYSRGGWLSGWSRNRLDSATTVARIDERSAFLDVVLDAPAVEIVLRARGRGKIGVAPDKGRATSRTLGDDYALHRFALPNPLSAGRQRIKLTGKGSSIDWIWFSEQAGADAPDLARTDGDALAAPSPRSYRYFVIPEAGGQLEFSTEAGSGASIQVVAQQDGAAPQVLLESDAGQAHGIPLDAFAGRPTQLTLRSLGGAVSWKAPRITRPATDELRDSAPPKNVIVLLIDTQRADSFSVVDPGGGIGASSYESLIKSSSTFKNAYNNENWTKPSIATLDTGLYPDTHLARWRKDRCSSDLVFLSEHLQAQGFATAALVANKSGGPRFGFDQGWDLFEKTDNAEQTFGRAEEWLRKRDKDKRFFLFVQTIDPHVPFSVPEGAAEALYGGTYTGQLGSSFEQSEEDALNAGKLKLSADDARWLRALYDAEVLYHDRHLGFFLDALRAAGTLENTAFVIVNDHGEEFGEQGRWGHGWTMGDALFRSPLLMHLPSYFPTRTFDEVVEHLDVAPTIVDALGLPAMASAQGQSLLPLIQGGDDSGRAPYSALMYGRPKYRAIRVGDYKLQLDADRDESLFDIAADPAEAKNVIEKMPVARRLCELALGEAIANPARAERLSDRSTRLKVRAQYID